jgi:glycine/D-amino acid oxidase-like deaminating enzyme
VNNFARIITRNMNATLHRNHAVVIGGSIAGLLAARVLADHFEHITLIERDRLPERPQPRKGVPQASHVHVMLVKGWAVSEGYVI